MQNVDARILKLAPTLKQAQQALKNDSRSAATAADVGLNSIVEAETNVANQIMFFNAGENKPSHYDESYTELRKWVAESLELYKVEVCVRCSDFWEFMCVPMLPDERFCVLF